MNIEQWTDEATWIERELRREWVSPEFNGEVDVMLRYVRMQLDGAFKAGAMEAATRISAALDDYVRMSA